MFLGMRGLMSMAREGRPAPIHGLWVYCIEPNKLSCSYFLDPDLLVTFARHPRILAYSKA